MRNIFIVVMVSFLTVSCTDPETRGLRNEIKVLSKKVDSIQTILDSIKLRPYIDNMDFEIRKGETFDVNILAVNKGGVRLKSLSINGDAIDLDDSIVSYSDFGPSLSISPDSVGEYTIRAEVNIKSWGDKLIPLEWPIHVIDKSIPL